MRFRAMGAAALTVSILTGFVASASVAQAKVNVTIDLSTQQMHVTSSSGSYTWRVSTAVGRYHTPRGVYRPTSLQRMHYSRKYHNSPMPYSIFFRGGYAIHGTYAVSRLGTPASHGCVRLHKANAAILFAMVKKEGARIHIIGSRAQFYANYRATRARYASKNETRTRQASSVSNARKVYYVKRYKKVAYYVKRYKNGKKYYVKRYKTKKFYVKRYRNQNYAARSATGRLLPLAYAPVRGSRSAYDFFHNPDNI